MTDETKAPIEMINAAEHLESRPTAAQEVGCLARIAHMSRMDDEATELELLAEAAEREAAR